jgi:hypothetical protein
VKQLVTLWTINSIIEKAVKVIIDKAKPPYDLLLGLKEV